jgi:ADP-ribose pyrophosphatase
LGSLLPDSGRLENHIWGFFADGINPTASAVWQPEAGIEIVRVSRLELQALILEGKFDHALHMAVIGLALTRGLFSYSGPACVN